MASVRGFILSHFGKQFLLIFLPFFSILSIVYIIRISILSSKISLNAQEFLSLFGFFLPDIFFYTLPISFVVALAATFTNLSRDSELIALFSFGLSPRKLLVIFIVPASLFTVLMLILSLDTIPRSTLAYQFFKSQKLAEAKLTITPNRLGQKFGDYIVFLESKKKDALYNIVLFATDNREKRVLIAAKKAEIIHKDNQFSLRLHQGTADTFWGNKIESITYDMLQLYTDTQHSTRTNWLAHGWSDISTNKNDMALFVYNIFLSLSPLLVLGGMAAFSIINPRYQNSHTYLVCASIIMTLYLAASYLRKEGDLWTLLLLCLLFFGGSVFFFYKKTKARF